MSVAQSKPIKRKTLPTQTLIDGVLRNDRALLARAITLIESSATKHFKQGQAVLTKLLSFSGKSIRIGITGMPGAGKSTLIETFGKLLLDKGFSLAVLAVDPSSTITGGSILGDKTRMTDLANHPNCFIRPSPSSGALGGVARKTRETMLICEAAGYDVIFIETVGVGQSEIAVRTMVDFFMLLQIAGGGDELQGIKKGVIEMADAIFINKADGENIAAANRSRAEFNNALKLLSPATKGWKSRAFTCSALTSNGIPEIWELIENFRKNIQKSGEFDARRQAQANTWMIEIITAQLQKDFFENEGIKKILPKMETDVQSGKIAPTAAAFELLDLFRKQG